MLRLKKETDLRLASDLYKGRAFKIASEVAERMAADFSILSAGLGYVRSGTSIPGYDLTIRPSGPGSVARKVNGEIDPRVWWTAINEGPFSSNLRRDVQGRKRVFVCLSRSYAAMVETDLIKVSKVKGIDLRLFGLSLEAHLPEQLRPHVMPYDERLEALGKPGTRVDFPQRALLDFVTNVVPATSGSLAADRRAVLGRMGKVRVVLPKRKQRRLSDREIRNRIADLIPRLGTTGSRILRHLRDVDGVSCEQSRFAGLLRSVKRKIRS